MGFMASLLYNRIGPALTEIFKDVVESAGVNPCNTNQQQGGDYFRQSGE